MKVLNHFGVLGVAAALSMLSEQAAVAQTKEFRGTVTAVSDSSLEVRSGAQSLSFVVDGTTVVQVAGGSTRTRRAEAAGKEASIRVTDYVKAGGGVLVQYREAGGRNHATNIRPITSAGSENTANAMKNAQGKVKTISGKTLIVDVDGHDMTFMIDGDTDLLARGAGAATRKAGSVPITDFVHSGDLVRVGYRDASGAMKAVEIQIRGRNTIAAK